MDANMKKTISEQVRGFRLPRYAELPNMGLYLEQTVKYINSVLEPLGGMELTGSMVSNYVKKDLIANPVKKQYYAEQIAYLFFVVVAKNQLSMEDIGLLIEMQRNTYTLPVAYDYLCDELENMLFYIFAVRDTLEDLGTTQSPEKDLLRSVILSFALSVFIRKRVENYRNNRLNEK